MQELSLDDITDVILGASRALVAVAARSLVSIHDDVTLPQYRVLVVLCARGPSTMGQLVGELRCSGSTATRLCDRLVAKGLVGRTHRAGNRREVEVRATKAGEQLVRAVTKRRRREIEAIVESIPTRQRAALVRALRSFADAAGEVPEQAWATGWDL